MTNFRMQKPCKELADYVRFFWTLEAKVASVAPFVHRALPDNCIELIFYCRGQLAISSEDGAEGNTFPSGVFGQAQKYRLFTADSDFTLFGVYLYPVSFAVLFGLPASELTDHKIDSQTLWGVEGKILEERVMLAGDDTGRIEIVSNFLLNRIKRAASRRDDGFVKRLNGVIESNGFTSIPSLVDDFNLSRRQFERKFKAYAGLSPKDFLRIVRFKNALKASVRGQKSLAQIAIECGYYDQSHFTLEFKKYSGYSPREYALRFSAATDTRATRDSKG